MGGAVHGDGGSWRPPTESAGPTAQALLRGRFRVRSRTDTYAAIIIWSGGE